MRRLRSQIMTKYIHIIVQGINKSYIFEDTYIKRIYLNLLINNIKNTNIEILAYCIMDNHAHILIYAEKIEELTQFMHRVNTIFAIKYNNIKNRVGYVFRNRFYTQPITDRRQLYNCLVYIHRNPIKANIVQRYEDYKYSSYQEFYNKREIINEVGIELLFGSSKNFMEIFEKIHKNSVIEDIDDIQEFIDEREVLKTFFDSTDKNIEEIKKDKKELKRLIMELKKQSGLSLRKMAYIFDMSKDAINKIIKEN